MVMRNGASDTWVRLLHWTRGSFESESLAASLMRIEGYTDVDPIHPTGGPDGGKDALARREGKNWAMAAYFPSGSRAFAEILGKFGSDLEAITDRVVEADGMVFVTNQELSESRRRTLDLLASEKGLELDLVHGHRIRAILDQPAHSGLRAQFLGGGDGPGLAVPSLTVESLFRDLPHVDRIGPIDNDPRFNGVLTLDFVARPALPMERYPDRNTKVRLNAAADVARRVDETAAWPAGVSQLATKLRTWGWEALDAKRWVCGAIPAIGDAGMDLMSGEFAALGFRTRDVTIRVARTWRTTVYDRGEQRYFAAREPEIVAETLVALAVTSEIFRDTGAHELDVGLRIRAAPQGRAVLVSSQSAMSARAQFDEPSPRITSSPNVPVPHEECGRFALEEVHGGYAVAGALLDDWLSLFRSDDLIRRLGDAP